MDPLSGAASAIAVVTLAGQLTKIFVDLQSSYVTLPQRLHALSNEVSDLAAVLHDIAQLSAVDVDIPGRHQGSIPQILTHLHGLLQELKSIFEGPLTLAAKRRKSPLLQIHAWNKNKGKLQQLEQQIRKSKAELSLAIEASNSRDLLQVRLDLENIGTNTIVTSQMLSMLRDELLRSITRNHAILTDSLTSIDQRWEERMAKLEQVVVSQGPMVSSHFDMTAMQLALHARDNTVGFRLRRSADVCRPDCRCACHQRTNSASPAVLGRVVGQLFVGYSGLPLLRPICNDPLCEKPLVPQVSLEYWFPMGLFWSLIIQIFWSYTSRLGPSLQVRTIRRVPDNAPCVEFAIAGNTEGLKYLFKRGLASPRDVSSTRGYSLLRWALYTKRFDTCIFLLHEGADPDYGTYGSATATSGSYKVTSKDRARSMLLEPNLFPKAETALRLVLNGDDWIDDCGFTPVHRAVVGLSTMSIEEAIRKHMADLNAPCAGGRTPLAWAALRGDDKAVGLLLAHSADPNLKENHGSTPLYNAAENGSPSCCRLLLEAGALPDPPKSKEARLSSALVAAAIDGKQPLTAEILLNFGADCEACGPDGKTALIHSARMNNACYANLLLDHGANIDHITAAGETPLTTAITYNSHDVLKLLLERQSAYRECPRRKSRNLLSIIARYADHDTISQLTAFEHLRQRCDKAYGLGSFAKHFHERFDADEKLLLAFRDLVTVISVR